MNKTKKPAELLETISLFFRGIYLSANPDILKLVALVLGLASVNYY
ncbi:MAG: hypothetical protein ACXV8I_09195 [Methylobacter sp.]